MNFSTSSSGGTLNASKDINIRGIGSIGKGSSTSPLVLIDGMEGDLNSLNPQDIENISVLKDASASSIYGSRASGGVILVTTKSGKAGKTVINYNNSFRFNSPLNMPEMMDSYSWAKYMNYASEYGGSGTWFSPEKLQAIKDAQSDPTMKTMFANSNNRWEVWDNNDLLPIANTDWLKEHFGNSFSHEHTLSINGGSEKMRYYFSANYLNQDGILRHGDDNQQRYAVTAKIDADITSWLKMTYSARFTRTDYQAPTVMVNGTDEFYHNMCRYWPIIPTVDPNGHYVAESYIERMQNGGMYKSQKDILAQQEFYHNMCRYWPIIPTVDPNGHYVAESYIERMQNGGMYKSQKDILAQQLAFRLTPLKGLVINAELNYRINNDNDHTDWQTTYGYNVDNQPFVDFNANSSVKEYNLKSNYFNPNIFAEYSHSLADHNFKIMAGFQSEWFRNRDIEAQQFGIVAGLPTLNTTGVNPTAKGGYNTWTTVMAGFQSEWFRNRDIEAQQFGIVAGLPTLNTTGVNPTAKGGYNTWTTAGFFGRLNYD